MWQALEPVVQPILILLGVSLLAVLVLGAVSAVAHKRWYAWGLLVVAHALLVLTLMVTWVNGKPGFFEENTRLVQMVSGVRELYKGPPDPRAQGVDLILIDQVKSKVVVDDKGRAGTGVGVAVTDRAQLTALMQLLAPHRKDVGLVVCDILFTDSTEHDSALAAAMEPLLVDGKLLLARGGTENVARLRFDVDMGDVTAATQGGKVVRQTLLDATDKPTLPYLMHMRYNGLDPKRSPWGYFLLESVDGKPQCAYPYFLPFMDRLSEASYKLPEGLGDPHSIAAPHPVPLRLHKVVGPGKDLLIRRIQESPAKQGPVIFVGEFLSSPEGGGTDLHRTFRGDQQGATILLNQFLELHAGTHRFKGWPLVWQALALVLISLLIFEHFRPDKWLHTNWRWYYHDAKHGDGKNKPKVGLYRALLRSFGAKLLDALPALLIAMFFGLVGWHWHQPANIGALTFYLVVLDRLARLANKNEA